jgi:hypothetical protein
MTRDLLLWNVLILASCSCLSGDVTHWNGPSSSDSAWQNNALQSLNQMVSQYGLEGIDLNYENSDNNWQGFASNWCPVLKQLKQQHQGFVVNSAPFSGAYTAYQELDQSCDSIFNWINWQVRSVYAHLMEGLSSG